MNIEVGMYVRTSNQGIKKIDIFFDKATVNKYGCYTGISDFEGKEFNYIRENNILKASHNIIDLIEVGDLVNGEIVIDYSERGLWLGYGNGEDYSRTTIDQSEIKTILTKEQIKANQYEIKGE